MIDLRPILFVIGVLLVILGAVMGVPAGVDLWVGNPDWKVFVASSAVTFGLGGLLILTNAAPHFDLNRAQCFVLTVAAWAAVCMAGALPLLFSGLDLSFTDAMFESVSGFTTTGSTVIAGLDSAPPGILLWRSLTQWIGGIGIVVVAITMFPFLRIGGMQLFHTESSDRSEKLFPRASQVGAAIGLAYTALTLMCAASLIAAGMNGFDAVCHAMTTLATGGFSTKDASIAFYKSSTIEWVEVVFMTIGALPLIFYARLVQEGRRALWSDIQIWEFLGILGLAIAVMTLWLWWTQPYFFADALRLAAFNVTSIITDTGFATADFSLWGTFALGAFLSFYFIGGCAGSTAGAIKIFRWHVMLTSMRKQLMRTLWPNRVILARYNAHVLDNESIVPVFNFFLIYVLTFAALSLLLMAQGLDVLTSSSAIAQAMANAGPGLGDLVGPASNFAGLPNVSKWVIALAMVVGRLELLTVYVVLMPSLWVKRV